MRANYLFVVIFVLFTFQLRAQPTLLSYSSTCQLWNVFELTIQDNSFYLNPFWDVKIVGEFVNNSGPKILINGFYYEGNLWKIRFSPQVVGNYTFTIAYIHDGITNSFQGSFSCVDAVGNNYGFIKVNPNYPHKFQYSNGSEFFPRGLANHTPAIGAAFLGISPGSNQVPAMWDSMAKYSINTFRVSLFHQREFEVPFTWNTSEGNANFFYSSHSLDKYDTFVGKIIDRWFEQSAAHGIAIYFCLLNGFDIIQFPFSSSPWSSINGGPYTKHDYMYQISSGKGFELLKKYFSYVVSRYAAYRNVVLWEYNSEYAYWSDPKWLAVMDSIVRANDPYGRDRTVSFWSAVWSNKSTINFENSLTVTDDHFYPDSFSATEFNGDINANTQSKFRFSTFSKPVMFGEFGAGETLSDSWFTFQRIAYWGAFTGGGSPLFWLDTQNNSTGYSFNQKTIKFLGAVNKVLRRIKNFNTMEPGTSVASSNPNKIRVFSLENQNESIIYIHNYINHTENNIGQSLIITPKNSSSSNYSGVWLDATTADSLGSWNGNTVNGKLTIEIPSFTMDKVLYLSLQSSTSVDKIRTAPSLYSLSQNYPNPFNPSTTIKYSIPQNAKGETINVTLKIYDVLGREVATLIDEAKSPGTYELKFNLEAFHGASTPSGIYFYRINAGLYTYVKKMLLLK